jgi:predicted transcriptional regulator of viral defense system
MHFPDGIRETAQWQAGVVSRRQLLAAGFSSDAVGERLRRGHWEQMYRGVYALFSGVPDREAWLWAAVLRAGPGAVLSHCTAAELHGLVDPPDEPSEAIHVTVPSTRRIEARGIGVHISGRIEQATQANRQPPRTSVEETVLDLTQLACTFDDVCGWITRACGRRRTTEDRLREAIDARKKIRWRAELGEILTVAGSGIHSALEYRYLRDVERAHGLPQSRHQVRVRIDGKNAYRDAYYDEYKVAVELDGRLAHRDEDRWRDNHRDIVASAEGIQTCRYTWQGIRAHPCETAVWQAKVLREQGWPGTPVPCSPHCPVALAFG